MLRISAIISAVLLSLSVEWLSLLVLACWTMAAALWLVVQAGKHDGTN